jgi:branched-chain amino acid transport system ATP-binding protein
MSDPILRLSGLFTDIAQYHILQGVDLEVPRGQVTMLLGRNGVGKTTTLRSIIGHWQARAGRIEFDGRDVTTMPVPARVKTGMGYVPEDMGIFTDLTVEENMRLAARSGPWTARGAIGSLVPFPRSKPFGPPRPATCRVGRSRCCRSPV